MSTALASIVYDYRAHLMRQSIQVEQSIRASHRHMLLKVKPYLGSLYKQMEDAGDLLSLAWLYQKHRLEVARSVVSSKSLHFGKVAQAQIVQSQHVVTGLGVKSGLAQIGTVVASGIAKSPATKKPSDISPLFASFGAYTAKRVGRAIVVGVSTGQKVDRIALQVDSALFAVLYQALTIARTELAQEYRDAVLDTFQANDDVVQMWEWVAQASACNFCLSMNGSLHALDEEMESHPNCMCVMQLVTV